MTSVKEKKKRTSMMKNTKNTFIHLQTCKYNEYVSIIYIYSVANMILIYYIPHTDL